MISKAGRKNLGLQVLTIVILSVFLIFLCSALLIKGEALNQVGALEDDSINVDNVSQRFSIVTPLVVLKASAPQQEENVEQPPEEEVTAPEEVQEEFTWAEEEYTAVMYLTSDCNIRSEPRVESQSVEILKSGTQVNVIAKTDKGFYKIDNGFISDEYLTETAPVTASQSTSAIGTTGYAQLDELILGIFDNIFTPGMSDSQKIRACYEYMINNTTYQKGMPMPGGFGDTSVEGSDSYVASAAYGCLTTGKGSCNRYSAAFVSLMRVLGYEAHYITGLTSYANGTMGGHAWTEVVIDGTAYIFDPQVEDSMLGRGEGDGYTRYWKTYGELGSKYVKQ